MFDSEPIYFATAQELRTWFEQHHASASELVIGYWKAQTGKPSIRWAEAVREALCFGWIDGQGRGIDGERHMQRFTPRKSRRWSAVNVAHVAELEAGGLMTVAGRRAFEARDTSQLPYSTSKRPDRLPPEWDERLRREHPAAAAFWDTTPASYRKTCAFWITDAKRPDTRAKRFAELVEACARGERLSRFVSPTRRER
ncbi:MAG: hypothetical protein QOK21_2960 [Solirubrobacteraceae bacterium]|nr:hypothetical protein [Solirubrobacteraceae bacterium]